MENDRISFNIHHASDVPKYQQLMNIINNAIANNVLVVGDSLPSVNSICRDQNMSRATVFKAYSKLKDNDVIKSVPNKGYYVGSEIKKVLLVLDTFKAYKEVLYCSFVDNLPSNIITDVQFHHYNTSNFKSIINNSIGKYYKYVVMGFDNDSIASIISQIPTDKLVLIDWNVNVKPENNFIFQDFGKSFYKAILSAKDALKKYKEVRFIYPDYTNHPLETIVYFKKFCTTYKIKYRIIHDSYNFKVEKNIAYISVSDRVLRTFLEECKKRNLEPGIDVGFLSYNETPMKKFIYKGISVISTDFNEMGTRAARFISENRPVQCYIPTCLIKRESL